MQRAYVLHVRPYTDSRILIDFFTESDGLVRAVGRVPGKRDRAKYQPFQLVEIEFVGTLELKSLRACEWVSDEALVLHGHPLFCGFYVNELLQRLLHPGELISGLFSFYCETLRVFQANPPRDKIESVLRRLEFFLLDRLGFGVDFDRCSDTGESIAAEKFYFYRIGHGFCECSGDDTDIEPISGRYIIAIRQQKFSDDAVLKSAKIITRLALSPLLGDKPLKSRDLFR